MKKDYGKYSDFSLTMVNEDKEVYGVFLNVSDDEFDTFAIRIISEKKIEGIIPMVRRGNELGYCLTGLKPLEEAAEHIREYSDKDELLSLLGKIILTASRISAYGLISDKLVINPKHIYVKPDTGEVFLMYYPLMRAELDNVDSCLDSIISLCQTLKGDSGSRTDYMQSQQNQGFGILKENQEAFYRYKNDGRMTQPGEGTEQETEDYGYCKDINDIIGEKISESRAVYGRVDEVLGVGGYAGTEIFDALQSKAEYGSGSGTNENKKCDEGAENSREDYEDNQEKSACKPYNFYNKENPVLIRKKSNTLININRNIFKLGKDREYVDYCIDDNGAVSRSHAQLVRREDGFYIEDNESLNYTYVNGVRVMPNQSVRLSDDSLIQLADEIFIFRYENK